MTSKKTKKHSAQKCGAVNKLLLHRLGFTLNYSLEISQRDFCHSTPSPPHLRRSLRLDCLAVFPGVAMTTKALTRETDTHEHTAASRSGHTTIWLESLSKFGLFGIPYMARAVESLQRPHRAYLSLSLSFRVCVCVCLISLVLMLQRSDLTHFAVTMT